MMRLRHQDGCGPQQRAIQGHDDLVETETYCMCIEFHPSIFIISTHPWYTLYFQKALSWMTITIWSLTLYNSELLDIEVLFPCNLDHFSSYQLLLMSVPCAADHLSLDPLCPRISFYQPSVRVTAGRELGKTTIIYTICSIFYFNCLLRI